MRVLVCALMLAAMNMPANATEKDIGPYMDALVSNLALAYFCRDAIGIASYQATRSGTALALAPHLGENPAIVFVNDMDEKFKNDPRRFAIPDANRCYKMKGDAMHLIKVERAKLAQ